MSFIITANIEFTVNLGKIKAVPSCQMYYFVPLATTTAK